MQYIPHKKIKYIVFPVKADMYQYASISFFFPFVFLNPNIFSNLNSKCSNY